MVARPGDFFLFLFRVESLVGRRDHDRRHRTVSTHRLIVMNSDAFIVE